MGHKICFNEKIGIIIPILSLLSLLIWSTTHHCTVKPKCCSFRTNRIYHWSQMQTEKSHLESKWTMLETKFTKFPAFSIDLRVGISRSASETNV